MLFLCSSTFKSCFLCPAAFLSGLAYYEIAVPIRVGPHGDYDADSSDRHRRHRRSPETKQEVPEPQLYYQLSTPSTSLLLNLTLQSGLLSRGFRVEYWRKGRRAWSHPYSSGCQYVGHLQHQPQSSTVALSNCNGLVRLCINWVTSDFCTGGEVYSKRMHVCYHLYSRTQALKEL